MQLLIKKNYLAVIENSVKGENHTFRNLYMEIDGKEVDILKDGMRSCAFYASFILYPLKLIKDMHATVDGLEKDLVNSGWQLTSDLKEGAIIIWEKKKFDDGQEHRHVGFFLGNGEAVSNDSNSRLPQKHDLEFGGRKIEKIYTHPELS